MNSNLFGQGLFFSVVLFLFLVKDQVHGGKPVLMKIENEIRKTKMVFSVTLPDAIKGDAYELILQINSQQYWNLEGDNVTLGEGNVDNLIKCAIINFKKKLSTTGKWELNPSKISNENKKPVVLHITTNSVENESSKIDFIKNTNTTWLKIVDVNSCLSQLEVGLNTHSILILKGIDLKNARNQFYSK